MEQPPSLEEALASVDRRVGNAVSSVSQCLAAVKRAQKAATTGDLTSLKKAIADQRELGRAAQADISALSESWPYSEDEERRILDDGRYLREVMSAAERQNLVLTEQDGLLLCYPVVVRVDAVRRTVTIDRVLFRDIRPSALVSHLSRLQRKPLKTRPAPFLESLYRAWDYARHRSSTGQFLAPDVKVDDLWAVLTVAPGGATDYPRQEFGRDLYLLERSDVRETRSGARVHFSRSTGAKERGHTIVVVGEDGRPVMYSSIGFSE